MAKFFIGEREVGPGRPVLVIAEAGVNHNGDLSLAIQLIDAAVDCGADVVKFQSFRTEEIVTRSAPKADYQTVTAGTTESQFQMLKRLELKASDQAKLQQHCESRGIVYLSTPYDPTSAKELADQKVKAIKIASTDTTNLPFLHFVGKLGIPVILSTGMSEIAEVRSAFDTLRAAGLQQIALLHCTSEYPAPMDELNLAAIQTLRTNFDAPVGFSDHSSGIEAATWAVAMGACIVEKHFTLDRSMPGPDHAASAEPSEMKKLIQTLRQLERSIGDGVKRSTPSEQRNKPKMQKSLVARCVIKEGEIITEETLTAKRPATGLSPLLWRSVIGKRAAREIAADEILTKEAVRWE